MKKVLITIGVLAAIGGTAVFIRSHVAPHFSIEQVDYVNRTGIYMFGRMKTPFGISNPLKGTPGRNGYSIEVKQQSTVANSQIADVIVFNLYKKQKLIKQVGMVNFTAKTATGMY